MLIALDLRTESQAQRNLDFTTSRKWIVINPAARNSLGHPTGYALLPNDNTVLYAQPDSWVRRRAGFLNSHVWVTPYRASEIYARGDYPTKAAKAMACPDGPPPTAQFTATSSCGTRSESRTIPVPRIGP